MGDLRAVGASEPRRIPVTVLSVNARVDGLEALMTANRTADQTEHAQVMSAISGLKDVIGQPSQGDGVPAKGMFHLLESLDKRVRPFEGAWLQCKGAVKAAVPILAGSAALMWFFAGDRITALFHS